jgi:hypothetical protein
MTFADRETGADTLDDLNERWTSILGPMPPGFERIPDEVLLRTGEDERFARYLVESRRNPSLLALLFADPKNQTFRSEPAAAARPEPMPDPSGPRLSGVKRDSSAAAVARAATSLAKWGATAFESVEHGEAERRLVVCRACPHVESIDAAPAITRLTTSEVAICGLCGCPLGRKARMASEQCPDADPHQPGLNRWGQKRRA